MTMLSLVHAQHFNDALHQQQKTLLCCPCRVYTQHPDACYCCYRYPSGESYLDVIQRLEPVIIEMERERECVCVVAHQAVLRAVYGYFTATPLKDIPRLDIPLHTLIGEGCNMVAVGYAATQLKCCSRS